MSRSVNCCGGQRRDSKIDRAAVSAAGAALAAAGGTYVLSAELRGAIVRAFESPQPCLLCQGSGTMRSDGLMCVNCFGTGVCVDFRGPLVRRRGVVG